MSLAETIKGWFRRSKKTKGKWRMFFDMQHPEKTRVQLGVYEGSASDAVEACYHAQMLWAFDFMSRSPQADLAVMGNYGIEEVKMFLMKPEEHTKEWYIGWIKAFVAKLDQSRYPIFSYRAMEPLVRRFDPGLADRFAKLQALRDQEKAILNETHQYLKTRLDGK